MAFAHCWYAYINTESKVPSRIYIHSWQHNMICQVSSAHMTSDFPVQLKTVEGVDVDISLGNDDGVKAADMTKAKLRDFPAARALTIVTKAFLKARRLTDVSTGGLGGYALVNMIIAHLQEEAKVPACNASARPRKLS